MYYLYVKGDITCPWITQHIFKQFHGIEDYPIDLPESLRIPLSKFRCRNTRLPIEVGTYTNIDRENRKCNTYVTQMLWEMNFMFYLFKPYNKAKNIHIQNAINQNIGRKWQNNIC